MSTDSLLPASLGSGRIVPVLTVHEVATVAAVGRGLLAGGIKCVEVTLRTPQAWEAIAELRTNVPELTLGVGTVLTVDDVRRAREAGAAFLVSPGFDQASVDAARDLHIPVIPGVATPSEVMAARAAGLQTVKVFPVDLLGGVHFLRTLATVFPDIQTVPSGGVTSETASSYLALPSVLAVSGSWMLPRDAANSGDEAEIARVSAVAVARAENDQ